MKNEEAVFLTKLYLKHHEMVLEIILKKTGKIPKEYKLLEEKRIIRFFHEYSTNNKNQLEQIAYILSHLILIQALPNTNHRTSIYFIRTVLTENHIKFPIYDAESDWEKWRCDCDNYIEESKYLQRILNEREILKRQYMAGNKFLRMRDNNFKEIFLSDLFLSDEELEKKHEETTKNWLSGMLKNQSIILTKASADPLKNLIVSSLRTMSSSDSREAS